MDNRRSVCAPRISTSRPGLLVVAESSTRTGRRSDLVGQGPVVCIRGLALGGGPSFGIRAYRGPDDLFDLGRQHVAARGRGIVPLPGDSWLEGQLWSIS